MKEPYEKGLATHLDPEPCVVVREGHVEASVGARAGRTLSREIMTRLQGADAVRSSGRPHQSHRHREMPLGPARSETPGTHGNSLRGSREIPRLASTDSVEVRAVNPQGARRR
jgi:hypothetical protein